MKRLGSALFILAVAASSILLFAPPAVAQRLINGKLRLGDSTTPVRISGNLELNAPIYPQDTTLGMLIDGGMTVTGASAFGTVRVTVLDAGQIWANGYGPIVRIIPFTSGAFDFGSTTTTCNETGALTATGARAGDSCFVGPPTSGGSTNAAYTCYVSATDQVKVRHCAVGTADDPASATFNGVVISTTP